MFITIFCQTYSLFIISLIAFIQIHYVFVKLILCFQYSKAFSTFNTYQFNLLNQTILLFKKLKHKKLYDKGQVLIKKNNFFKILISIFSLFDFNLYAVNNLCYTTLLLFVDKQKRKLHL